VQANLSTARPAQRDLNRSVGSAMLWARATAVQGRPVVGRTIAFIAGEAVRRKSRSEDLHQLVPGHLGDDRGRRDRQHQLISPGDAALRDLQVSQAQMVDQQEAGRINQFTQGPLHRQPGRREHPDPIELPGRTLPNPDRERNPPDLGSPAAAGERGELFGIPDPFQGPRQVEPIEGQDHRSRNHRTGQGAPPDLI